MRPALAAAFLLGLAIPQAATVDPATLPAHDSHQGILVACDPYSNGERAKKAFGRDNPLRAGILPLEVYIRNSNTWPVALSLDAVRLEIVRPGGPRSQLMPLSAGDVATLILHPRPVEVAPAPRRLPIPIPSTGSGSKEQKLARKLETFSFPAAVVAPGATVHGFFFFDLGGQFDAVRYARFYVPDLKFLGNSQAIMFFEAELSPAASH